MNIFSFSEKLMSMSDRTWMRHANPWSVWTRFTCLPLICLAVWSRAWVGWWSLAFIALAVLWTWYNPRAFNPPQHTDRWASKGTFGERIFIERRRTDIPAHHRRAATVLTGLSALGLPVLIYGLAALNFWATACGVIAVVFPKVWFVDRMVWIYEDMKDTDDRYKSWLK